MPKTNTKTVLRGVKTVLRGVKNSCKFTNPWGPYKRMSDEDRESFREVLSTWRPEGQKPVFILRWSMTTWCNYNCPYCPQTHDRLAPKGKEFTAHAFDNYPLEKWLEAFHRHFAERGLSMVITGGEPMLDRKNMLPFLKGNTSPVCNGLYRQRGEMAIGEVGSQG